MGVFSLSKMSGKSHPPIDAEKTAEYPTVPIDADPPPGSHAPATIPSPGVDRYPSGTERVSWFDAPSTEKSLAVAARLGSARATLTVLTGVDAGQVMTLDGPIFVIGRGPSADYSIDDPGVSRAHTRLARSPD